MVITRKYHNPAWALPVLPKCFSSKQKGEGGYLRNSMYYNKFYIVYMVGSFAEKQEHSIDNIYNKC